MCRGHILAALSDHLLPVYVRHGTGRALWQAVARTYEPDATNWKLMLKELEFGEDETHRERVARVESLVIAGRGFPNNPKPSDDGSVPYDVCRKLPDVVKDAILHGDESTMDGLWRTAEAMERGDRSVQIWENERISSGHNAKRRR
ncbi:hypothetical protein HU200_033398 [Digitaria exilis]|uniref:Uncharacterized protein n=1 Tax=Digitaria exilis TaxID=1010633 RepID=A0A835BMY7_9POAL|nr:hypothetical protein HU200_033398 [Digitaria exilis]